jgi:hypothetical protein
MRPKAVAAMNSNARNERMPFGRHRGKKLADIPTPYLAWLLREASIEPWLERAVEAELARRDYDEPVCEAPQRNHVRVPRGVTLARALRLIEQGRRGMARTEHPDAGGNTEIMAEINATSDWLSEYLAEVLT